MRFLANENFPSRSVLTLRENGIDIKSIGVDSPGVSDRFVMETAIREERTILTFDRDYGELIFRHQYRPKAGVVYLRLDEGTPENPAQIILNLVRKEGISFERSLTVVDKNGIRQRKYDYEP